MIFDKKYYDGCLIVVKYLLIILFLNVVEDLFVYYVSFFDFFWYKKFDVYLVLGEGWCYEELVKILWKDKRVFVWVIDGRWIIFLDWVDVNCVCKICKFVFDFVYEGV